MKIQKNKVVLLFFIKCKKLKIIYLTSSSKHKGFFLRPEFSRGEEVGSTWGTDSCAIYPYELACEVAIPECS